MGKTKASGSKKKTKVEEPNEPLTIKEREPIDNNPFPTYAFHTGRVMVKITSIDPKNFGIDIIFDGGNVYDTMTIPYTKWSAYYKKKVKDMLQDEGRMGDFALGDHWVDSLFLSLNRRLAQLSAGEGLIEEKIPEKQLSNEEIKEAIGELKDYGLLYNIKKELDDKIVGEDQTKLMLYLICVSIKLKEKLSAMVTGESSSGKSFVSKNILKLIPPENLFDLTRISARALDHFTQQNWNDVILFVGEGAGAEAAIETIKMYTDDVSGGSKVLLAEKNEKTGKIEAIVKESRGTPVFITTSAKVVDDHEFMNRMLVLGTDTSDVQTEKIIDRITLLKSDIEEEEIIDENREKFHNMFRLLYPFEVKIPFLDTLKDMFSFNNIRSRRDFSKLVKIIESCTILHQYQRELIQMEDGREFLIAHPNDLLMAFEIGLPTFDMTAQNLEKSSKDMWEIITKNSDKLLHDEDMEKVKDCPTARYFTIGDLVKISRKKRGLVYNGINPLFELGLLDKRKIGREAHYYIIGSELNVSNVSKTCHDILDVFETYIKRLDLYKQKQRVKRVTDLPTDTIPKNLFYSNKLTPTLGGVYLSPITGHDDTFNLQEKIDSMGLSKTPKTCHDTSVTGLTRKKTKKKEKLEDYSEDLEEIDADE